MANGRDKAPVALDAIDRAILRLLAVDATTPLAAIAKQVGLSATPCWKRIKRMEEAGVITGRVVSLSPEALGYPVSVFVSVETSDHSAPWIERFAGMLMEMPEIVGAWRMSGDVDYLLHVMVPDIAAYDAFYRRLIALVPLRNVSSRFAMERLKASAPPI
ncbi:MAG TPA: Lrp/AsnC family transcriptional regulator [Acidiphilium sp.]|nr:MAG: transcriptional regulator [Acidiphilium sp. 21-60-14]OYV89732.1 MAG: transcriptional regulator [Acidiphilium sp. 37-60-79]OZB40900.1 MAG: transcriptional regulator [Acidiphilium sp. 34-60-192]HQT88554.1 Lrp/AsnC family transcriptional regulator [Acidiphilium sp.]HQU24377.1 Lrp/AsnC family transcriptional regulator [Acidiphilium sp.]